MSKQLKKQILIIAGPNGAGKTTFARMFLAPLKDSIRFNNADYIDAGLGLLHSDYKYAVNEWLLYDNSGIEPELQLQGVN